MNLSETILRKHSKANCDIIVNWVDVSQKRFDELFDIFLLEDYRLSQRAAWPLSYCVIKHPILIAKHFTRLVKNLHKPGISPAIVRNSLRLLQHIEIPKKHHGELMELCFQYISSNEQPVAIKAFSLTVLQNLSRNYPEIKPEIKLVIEARWPLETAAFRTRAKKFLQSL